MRASASNGKAELQLLASASGATIGDTKGRTRHQAWLVLP
jgi:hypothetical protein